MPDTYTKEQIAEAHARIRGIREISAVGGKPTYDETLMLALASALSTAEQERDALAARCADLEARLDGAADRAVKWQTNLCKADDWSCESCTECADLRAAIVGKKED